MKPILSQFVLNPSGRGVADAAWFPWGEVFVESAAGRQGKDAAERLELSCRNSGSGSGVSWKAPAESLLPSLIRSSCRISSCRMKPSVTAHAPCGRAPAPRRRSMVMRRKRLALAQFDLYDRFLLWSALRSGYLYARIESGPNGCWVAGLLPECPASALNAASAPPTRLIRLDNIVGLPESSPQPVEEPGPWLQSVGLCAAPGEPGSAFPESVTRVLVSRARRSRRQSRFFRASGEGS